MDIINRKARFNYFIEDTIECGISLTGTEIKSIRQGNCNITDSYAVIRKEEVYLLNAFISHYNEGNIFNHQERRTRKLLLHKSEIKKLNSKIELLGYTLVPLKIYFKGGIAKVLLGLARGKKDYDKRETIKQRDISRDTMKTLKNY
ncbi:MAG: SsrA-binding protein SmpB [Bacilli bacterium]